MNDNRHHQYKERVKKELAKKLENHRKLWTLYETFLASRPSLTARRIANQIGRTLDAVENKRRELKRA